MSVKSLENKQSPQPVEAARQTLIKLMQRKLMPTPDNYRHVYDEIMGVHSTEKSEEVSNILKKILQEMGKSKPKYVTAAQSIVPLIEANEWRKLEIQLRTILTESLQDNVEDQINWASIIRNLLKQLETSHKGVTISRKKEGLTKVLINFGNSTELLAVKIQSLISSWNNNETADDLGIVESEGENVDNFTSLQAAAELTIEKSSVSSQWRNMLQKAFELVIIPFLDTVPEAQEQAMRILNSMRQTNDQHESNYYERDLQTILLALEMDRENQGRIHESLLQLLRVLIDTMSNLVQVEDEWLHSQTTIISDLISKPLSLDSLYDAESSLKELAYKQNQLKPSLTEAKGTLKKMVSTFVQKLAEVAENTNEYHGKIQGYQDQISSADDINDLSDVLDNLLQDTQQIGLTVQRTHEEFNQTQQQVINAEKRIQELTAELDHIGQVAHQDYLTGTLNRRGMDEAFKREFSRSDRYNSTLSIAMLDIDHFKKLNDTLGHTTGDQALTHLAKVLKDVLRTTDVLARYGGEEFIIILLDTPLDEAIHVVSRIQRELTKRFFMHNNERVLITFSAGVAERKPKETPEEIIPRADKALYQAKHSGRNRVVAAES